MFNEGKHCSNHKIPFNDVELIAKDSAIFQRIMERFSNSTHTFEQNIAQSIDNKLDEIMENDKINFKVLEKRDKRLKSIAIRKVQIEKQKEMDKEEREKQKEMRQINEKKRIEKDPITKIQKNESDKRHKTEQLRKDR